MVGRTSAHVFCKPTNIIIRKRDAERQSDMCAGGESAYRAVVGVDLIQQSHDFFAQADRSGVAGRGRAVRQPHKAEETQESGRSQPHVGSDGAQDCFQRLGHSSLSRSKKKTCCSFKDGVIGGAGEDGRWRGSAERLRKTFWGSAVCWKANAVFMWVQSSRDDWAAPADNSQTFTVNHLSKNTRSTRGSQGFPATQKCLFYKMSFNCCTSKIQHFMCLCIFNVYHLYIKPQNIPISAVFHMIKSLWH